MIPLAFDAAGVPMAARPAWRIRFFGGLRVEGPGRSLSALARQPQTGALLAFLALHPFCAFSRSDLAERLWPDLPPERAAGALRAALYRLRRQIGARRTPLRIDRYRIAFAPQSPWWTDVRAFELLLQRARTAPPYRARMDLEAAVSLYAGDLLPDWEAPWVVGWRARFREGFLEALRRLWHLCEALGDLPAAEAWAERLIQTEPTDAPAVRFLIRQAQARGEHNIASRRWEAYRSACREAGILPDPALMAQGVASPGIRPAISLGRLLQALQELSQEEPGFPAAALQQAVLEAMIEAAERALARGDYARAAPWATAALMALSPETPGEWAWRARCAADAVADFWNDPVRQAENLRAMHRLARRMGDPQRRAEAVARWAWFEIQRGRFARAERLLTAAEASLTAAGPLFLALFRRMRGLAALRRGWFPAARAYLQAALELLPPSAPAAHRAATLNALAVARRHMGDYEGALSTLEEAWALLDEPAWDALPGRLIRTNRIVFRGWIAPPSPEGWSAIEACWEEARGQRDPEGVVWIAAAALRIALRWGDPERAEAWRARLEALWPEAGEGYEGPRAALSLALAHGVRGNRWEAARWRRRAQRMGRRWGRDEIVLWALALRCRWTPAARREFERLIERVGWEAWHTFQMESPFLWPRIRPAHSPVAPGDVHEEEAPVYESRE